RAGHDVVVELVDAAVLVVVEVLPLHDEVRVDDDANAARGPRFLGDVDAVGAERDEGVAELGARVDAEHGEQLPVDLEVAGRIEVQAPDVVHRIGGTGGPARHELPPDGEVYAPVAG